MSLREYPCYGWVQRWILRAYRTGSNIRFIAVAHEIAHAWARRNLLYCPSSTHSLGVIQWKREYKIPGMYRLYVLRLVMYRLHVLRLLMVVRS